MQRSRPLLEAQARHRVGLSRDREARPHPAAGFPGFTKPLTGRYTLCRKLRTQQA